MRENKKIHLIPQQIKCILLAAGEGFEPSHTESESAVLPLHNPAKRKEYYTEFLQFVKSMEDFL